MSEVRYKFVELSVVTDDALEQAVNQWVARGWQLDRIHFVPSQGSRRPAMAFVSFIRDRDGAPQPTKPRWTGSDAADWDGDDQRNAEHALVGVPDSGGTMPGTGIGAYGDELGFGSAGRTPGPRRAPEPYVEFEGPELGGDTPSDEMDDMSDQPDTIADGSGNDGRRPVAPPRRRRTTSTTQRRKTKR
jgi:hypothetical protein